MIKKLLRKLGLSPAQAVVVDAVAEEAVNEAGKAVLKKGKMVAKKLV